MPPLDAKWLADLGQRVRAITVGEPGEGRLLLGQEVTDTPDGTVRFTISIGDGLPCALLAGTTDSADVVLVEDYETATKLLGGAAVTTLLEEGRIKLRGDVSALLGRDAELAALGEAIGP